MTDKSINPLVTFALFSYNQENFIREALEAALAQDYSPLEIIVSDDSSTDRTFEVIKEVVARYTGPHAVLARQTTANRGSLRHGVEVSALARGKLLVLAAGDDVSKPSRVSILTEAWLDTGAWGFCSRYDRIDEKGSVLERGVLAPVLQGDGLKCYLDEEEGPVPIVHGCTSAYDARLFEHLQIGKDDYILAEDGALTILINLLGKRIVHLDESLVLYRESEGSLTNSRRKVRPSVADLTRDERRIERLARAQANRARLFLYMNQYLGSRQVRRLRLENVQLEVEIQNAKENWWKFSIADRIRFMVGHPTEKWALVRMLGFRIFILSKWLFRRISFSADSSN